MAKPDYEKCPFCGKKYRLDLDGALPCHNDKQKNMCKGSHRLMYLRKYSLQKQKV